MTKQFLITASVLGATAVILDAVGSFILKGNISESHLQEFNTGVLNQMFYTVVLLAITFMNRYVVRAYLRSMYYLFLIGVILFSVPMYLTSITELTGGAFSGLSAFPPFGSLVMIAGWIVLFIAGVTYKHKKQTSKT